MEYNLHENKKNNIKFWKSFREVSTYIQRDWINIFIALFFVFVSSAITVAGPYLIGDATDEFIQKADKDGLIQSVLLLLGLYFISSIANYFQIRVMGGVGQSILFKLRNAIFAKLQDLPLQFFNLNKSGDLISRINNDTDKLNQAFSETLLRFIGQIFIIIGVAGIMFWVHLEFALFVLSLAVILFIITYAVSPWVKAKNKEGLDTLGDLSGQVQESLSNFKVMVAFGRRDYLRKEFEEKNDLNRIASTKSGIANGILTPFYDLAANLANLIVIFVGIKLLIDGQIELGVLVNFILYTDRFFQPLRILAQLFTSIQTSLAAWNRVSSILKLESNLKLKPEEDKKETNNIIELKNVSFEYDKETKVLFDLDIKLEKGKTYAFVGPTGGGKSTTASLIARLYDATKGKVLFEGKNIASIPRSELRESIGFILQEPFLFSGTVGENIKYGNNKIRDLKNKDLEKLLKERGLERIISRFPEGLKTKISNSAENISLGQKQIVAFVRALLRDPKLLILDEATANIDTVTENILEEIVNSLPDSTAKLIIAHRLNTIQRADEIFFIAGGRIQKALDFDNALKLITKSDAHS